MKIENTVVPDKEVELSLPDDGNAKLKLTGQALLQHDETDLAVINENGMDFTSLPKVNGVDVALSTDEAEQQISLETQEQTIIDNITTVIVIGNVQPLTTVLYALQNDGANESGELTITQTSDGFTVNAIQNANDGYFSEIRYEATENNGSLLLHIIGDGNGLITDFKYRVNSVNTLYF